jgi:hypothetical protein
MIELNISKLDGNSKLPVSFIRKKLIKGAAPPKIPKPRLNVRAMTVYLTFLGINSDKSPGMMAALKELKTEKIQMLIATD